MAELRQWRDGPARSAITDFVDRVTEDGGPDYVEPPARVAVFDNDGTLWTEKPIVIQLDFTVRQLARLAESDAGLRERQPYRAAYEQDHRWMSEAMVKHYRGDDADLHLLMGAVTSAFDTVPVDAYDQQVRDFFADAQHPTSGRSYLRCAYAPMVELLRYLESHDFTTYIASAGDRDFMRSVAGEMYAIPPERVIGSALGLEYRTHGDSEQLLYKATMDFFDDGPEKPVRIWSRIGRRPILSFGNSNGDLPMLRYSELEGSPALRLLLAHDDEEREFAYTAGAEDALPEAEARGWTTVSMARDWTTVFRDDD